MVMSQRLPIKVVVRLRNTCALEKRVRKIETIKKEDAWYEFVGKLI